MNRALQALAAASNPQKGIRVLRETHRCPEEVQEQITRAGGVNRFGEPNFRIAWSGSRLGWIGGWWTDRDASGNEIGQRFEMREEPRWLPHPTLGWECWILESWRPAEWFGPRWVWEMQTTAYATTPRGLPSLPALGPYPSRGDYMLVTAIDEACPSCWAAAREEGRTDEEKKLILGQCSDRVFLQATPRVGATLARIILRNRERNARQIRAEIQQMQAIAKQASDKLDDEVMAEAQEVVLSKETRERIEYLIAPRIEKQLAATKRRLAQMTPEQKRLAVSRPGRPMAIPLPTRYLN